MRAARELGLRIPEDLSIVGYDDLPVTEWIGPPLTTIHQPLQEMAATATRMVLALARGEVPANPRIELGTELVIRESTAPPAIVLMAQFDLPLAELERYRPDVPEPADFDAFWASTLGEARRARPVLSTSTPVADRA